MHQTYAFCVHLTASNFSSVHTGSRLSYKAPVLQALYQSAVYKYRAETDEGKHKEIWEVPGSNYIRLAQRTKATKKAFPQARRGELKIEFQRVEPTAFKNKNMYFF